MIKDRGFSLIESIVAILLVGMLVVAMVFSFASARMYAASARHRYQAINIARDEIERIIRGETPSPGTVDLDTDTGLTGTLSVIPNPPVSEQRVTVTVSWTERMWQDTTRQETIVYFFL